MNDIFEDEPSDEVLMSAAAAGDMEALVGLHRRHAGAAYSVAAHMLGPTDAEEAVQEAFLRVWKNAGRFDVERGRFQPWFFTILRNHIADRLKGRRRELLARTEDLVELIDRGDPAIDVEEEVWRRDRALKVLAALRALPPEQRTVLFLAYFGPTLTQTQLAERLGWPLGTVKKRTHLALRKLRALLAEPAPEETPRAL